jgi:hypothetical protein
MKTFNHAACNGAAYGVSMAASDIRCALASSSKSEADMLRTLQDKVITIRQNLEVIEDVIARECAK